MQERGILATVIEGRSQKGFDVLRLFKRQGEEGVLFAFVNTGCSLIPGDIVKVSEASAIEAQNKVPSGVTIRNRNTKIATEINSRACSSCPMGGRQSGETSPCILYNSELTIPSRSTGTDTKGIVAKGKAEVDKGIIKRIIGKLRSLTS